MSNFVVPFAIGLFSSLLLTPLVRAYARRAGIVASPTGDRWHKKPTALLGGVAIFGGFAIAAVSYLIGWGEGSKTLAQQPVSIAILASATLMFVTGLVDDRYHLRPSSKLVMQALAAGIVVTAGVVYPLTPWAPVNSIATVFWFIGITNALNLLDNMDGVATGVSALAALFLALTFAMQGGAELVALPAALAGAALGFLPYNFHPASIFMGDSGSLFLGSLIASIGAAYPSTGQVGIVPVLFVPVFIAVIPILDTILVTVTRTLAGRPISTGGRDHTAHRLVALGLAEPQVALMLYAFAAIGGCVALLVAHSDPGFSNVLAPLFLVGLALFATYLARMHKYEPGQPNEKSRVTVIVSNLLYKKRALEVLLDLVIFGAAYYCAYALRYDGVIPEAQSHLLQKTVAIAIVAKSIAFWICGVYRGIWQYVSVPDLHRMVRASILGGVITTVALFMVFRDAEFARSVLILDAIAAAMLTIGARLSFRSFDRLRHRRSTIGEPVLIYGAGRGGEIAVRELQFNRASNLRPVGFIDDDDRLHGSMIHGVPVIGGSEHILEIALRARAKTILIGTNALNPQQLDRLYTACANAGIEVLEFKLQVRPYVMPGRTAPHRLAAE